MRAGENEASDCTSRTRRPVSSRMKQRVWLNAFSPAAEEGSGAMRE